VLVLDLDLGDRLRRVGRAGERRILAAIPRAWRIGRRRRELPSSLRTRDKSRLECRIAFGFCLPLHLWSDSLEVLARKARPG